LLTGFDQKVRGMGWSGVIDTKYICPCGLVCTDYLFFKPEIYESTKQLKNNIKDSQLDIFLTSISGSKSWRAIADHLNGNQLDFWECFAAYTNFEPVKTNGIAGGLDWPKTILPKVFS
jgi:hypothetical protein